MRTDVFWIDHPRGYRLGIMPRPRGGEWLSDEILAWREIGVDVVVSLLEREEVADLELTEEETLCHGADIEFLAFPIPDRGVPSDGGEAQSLAERICALFEGGKAVAIHCRAGIGRSSLVAGTALIVSGLSTTEALEALSDARGVSVPDTDEQLRWLNDFYGRVSS